MKKNNKIEEYDQRVTQVDIANYMGVSVTTVSKSLRGDAGISKKTIERVQRVAKQMGYTPNVFAQGLKTAKPTTIGLLITSDVTIPWYAQLVSKIEERAAQNGFTLMLALGKNNSDKERKCMEAFQGGQIGGVIVGPVFRQHDLEPLWNLLNQRLPVVLFSCIDDMPVDYVAIDHLAGSYTAVKYLIEMGHRRIGYLCCPPGDMQERGRTRREGFEKVLFEHELPLLGADILVAPCTFLNGYKAVKELVEKRRNDLPTAFFCHNDEVALGAIRAFQSEGFKIPEDISIIGYDDIEESEFSQPPLTTMGNVMDELVDKIFESLLGRMSGNVSSSPIRLHINPRLIVRSSVLKIK